MSAAPPPSFPSDIGVSIVAHNARGYIGRLLDSLSAAGCPPSSICVVDVASTDGLGEWLAAAWPGVLRSRLDRNDGPSPGRNVGIRWWTGRRFVLLLDADVQLEPDTITLLHETMVREPYWKIGSPVVVHGDRPDLIQYADTHLHFICEAINPYLDRSLAERGTDVRDIGVASTCALLLDRGVAIEAGLFDERYFIGKEDGDFTHRVKLAGHGILERPDARVRHITKPRTAWLFYYQIRNRWHFLLKNYEIPTLVVLVPALAIHETLQAILLVLKGHGGTYLRAVAGLIRLLPDLPADRAVARRIRVHHDRAVLRDGSLVVRGDLASPTMRRVLRAYEGALSGYWRLVRRLLP